MFSNWFFRWISRAMVTPSLVTTGVPVIFSRMTLRPLGPRVDFTASASWSTPASNRLRASSLKRSSLAIGPPGTYVRMRRNGDARPGLRDENGPAAGPPRIEVVECFDRGVQRVGLGVQRDLPRLSQGHQLGQLVVGTDDVADDVAFGGDDVQRRDVQRAAVADDEVGAGWGGHVPAVHLGALFGHEVQHHFGAVASGQVLDRVDLVTVGHDRLVRAELLGQLERVRVAVHDHDPGRAPGGPGLEADVTQAAGPDDHAGRAGV